MKIKCGVFMYKLFYLHIITKNKIESIILL